ncbi:MAG: hypothetical protein AAGE52_41840 [Myxococcota bacterium]
MAWLMAAAFFVVFDATAYAHGRPAAFQALAFDPGDPNHIVAQSTWGMAFSTDGGASWTWTCAAAYGVDARTEDPSVAFADGALVLGSFGGILESTDGTGCSWSEVPGPIQDAFGIDVEPDGQGGLLLIGTDGFAPDRLWRREGGDWAPHSEEIENVLLERLRVAPSNPAVVYVTGALPRRAEQERALFSFRSSDGGRTFSRAEVSLRGEEYAILAAAIAPDDPDVFWTLVLNFDGETAPERILRSTDGGRSFQTRFALPQVGGVVVRGDGQVVFAGSKLGGLWRSDNAGVSWRKIQDVAVRCLVEHNDELWICTDQSLDGVALVRTREGETLEPIVSLPEIVTLQPCPRCSEVGITCPAWTPDVSFDLGWDLEALGLDPPELEPDGGVGLPREVRLPEECGGEPEPASDGCGCGTTAAPDAAWLAGLLLLRRRSGKDRR